MVLVKKDAFCAFLCRLWARQGLYDAIRPLMASGGACPFAESGQLLLVSDAAVSSHYLELVLGRGPKEQCPQAEKYLCGVARDMTLRQQPYICTVLEGRCGVQADDSVLSV